tara:strand:- start:2342 stop:2542 length:201 start_codon:yes stop_codon:yes gene_type:complete
VNENKKISFKKITEENSQGGFLNQFYEMLMHNKKWRITPVALVLIFFGLLIILGGSSYAPFIYTLF